MIALLIAAALGVSPCLARDRRDAAGVVAAEARWVRAIETHDRAALACLLAPDFADSAWDGRLIRRGEMLDRIAARHGGRQRLHDMTVRLYGTTAIARGLNTGAAADGKPYTVRFTDVFVYRAGAWHAVAAQECVLRSG